MSTIVLGGRRPRPALTDGVPLQGHTSGSSCSSAAPTCRWCSSARPAPTSICAAPSTTQWALLGRFGGVPLLLLNFGEITEVATSEDEIVAQRNEVRGRDAGDVTTLLVPWREVQRGPYFVSVLNAWEPPAEGYGSKQIDVQDCDLTFRLVARLSEPLALWPTCLARVGPLTSLLWPADSDHYVRRWRHRKSELYREIRDVRSDLGALTATIEREQTAWLKDLQAVATLLGVTPPAESADAESADAESADTSDAETEDSS